MPLNGVPADIRRSRDAGWVKMLFLSLFLHLVLLCLILLVPEPAQTRRVPEVVYEVNLVSLPPARVPETSAAPKVKPKSAENTAKVLRAPPARPIRPAVPKAKPIVVAKRTIKSKKSATPKPRPPTKRLEKALARIEKRVKAERKQRKSPTPPPKVENTPEENPRHLDQALAQLEKKWAAPPAGSTGGSAPPSSVLLKLYQISVEEWIKNNWTFPVALDNTSSRGDLEAIVVVEVQSNGRILKSSFKRKSGHPVFNESVMRAIERSNPLPPFPEGYPKSREEIEINFNLRDLEG